MNEAGDAKLLCLEIGTVLDKMGLVSQLADAILEILQEMFSK